MAQQAPNLSLTEQIAFSTVRIEVKVGNLDGVGTGFFFSMLQEGDSSVPVIVTNKHVVAGTQRGSFVLTRANPDGTPNSTSQIPVSLDNFESRWIPHPDPQTDLAIMPIAPLINQAVSQGFTPFYRTIDKSVIPTEAQLKELTAVEEILTVGYPIGIWDRVNNYPIFRKGITATHPANKYEGRDEFMIDAASFPGCSGSPVFLYNVGNYVSRTGNTVIGSRFYFLGILYGGPEYTATGEVRITNIPHKQDTLALTKIPINLGNVIRSSKLLDFEDLLRALIRRQH
ncbi:MAG TPA: serine protease [Bacteroidota bacterium]|nr:serine protease [Bacteroidota bacterium]